MHPRGSRGGLQQLAPDPSVPPHPSTPRAGTPHTCSGWRRSSSPPWGSCPCHPSSGRNPCWRSQATGGRWCATRPPGTSTTGKTSGLDAGGGLQGSPRPGSRATGRPAPRPTSIPALRPAGRLGLFQGCSRLLSLGSSDRQQPCTLEPRGKAGCGWGRVEVCLFPPVPGSPGQRPPGFVPSGTSLPECSLVPVLPVLHPHPHALPAPGSSSARGSLWTSCPRCTTRWATCSTTFSTRASTSPCAEAPTPASTRPSAMCWPSPSPLLHTCTRSACWTRSPMTQVCGGGEDPAQPTQTPLGPPAGPHWSLLTSARLVSASLPHVRQVWGSTQASRPTLHPSSTAQASSSKQDSMVPAQPHLLPASPPGPPIPAGLPSPSDLSLLISQQRVTSTTC